MRKPTLVITGKTQDGRQVVGGVFKLFDTFGIPLDMVLMNLEDHGLVVDWPDFIEAALIQGWKMKTVVSRLGEAIPDVHGPLYYEGWKRSFEEWCRKEGKEIL